MATMFRQNENVQEQEPSIFNTVKNGYKYKLTPAQREQLANIVRNKASLSMDYMDFAKKHQEWANYADQQKAVDKQNRMYYMALLGICAVPLRHGVDAHSIATCIGMYAGICCMNPDFRKGIKGIVGEVMLPYYDSMKEMFPNSKFSKLVDKLMPNKEQLLIDKNHGRLPLTPETAAMQRIGWIEKAYDDMRKPGADVEDIMSKYNEACRALDDLCERDGISQKELSEKMQGYVCMRCQADPSYMKYYAELDEGKAGVAYRTFEIKDEKGNVIGYQNQVSPNVDEDGNRVYFYDYDSGNAYSGLFNPRTPASRQKGQIDLDVMCRDYVSQMSSPDDLTAEAMQADPVFDMRDNLNRVKFRDDFDYHNDFKDENFYYTQYNMSKDEFFDAQYDGMVDLMAQANVAEWLRNKSREDFDSKSDAESFADFKKKYTENVRGRLKQYYDAKHENIDVASMEDNDVLQDFYDIYQQSVKSGSAFDGYWNSNNNDTTYSGTSYEREHTESSVKTHYEGVLGTFDYDEAEFNVGKTVDEDGKVFYALYYVGNETDGSKIHIPNGVKDISFMFMNNPNIKSGPDIPASVEKCSHTFDGCVNLEYPSDIHSNINQCDAAYANCINLKRAPDIAICTNGHRDTRRMFDGCPRSVYENGKANIEHSEKNTDVQDGFEDSFTMTGFDV